MDIRITSVTVRYADENADSVQVHIEGSKDDYSTSINGYIPLSLAEYEGNEALTFLVILSRQKIASEIAEMSIKISSVNMKYKNDEISGVQVFYSGRNIEGNLSISGHIELTAEEYESGLSISGLTGKVRQVVLAQVSGNTEEVEDD